MNNTKIELSKLDQDYDSYVLTDNDKNRIKPIKDILRSQGISFKYFITISPYNFIPDNRLGRNYCSKENKFLKTKIRRFFKSKLRFLFFTERYSETSKHSGGLHRHFLLEEIPTEKWKSPTNSMLNFLVNFAPEAIFSEKLYEGISELHKEELIKRVCRLCNQTPTGNKGIDIRPIHNQEKLLGYCTKQMKSKDDFEKVLDIENSDCFTNLDRTSNGIFLKSSYHRSTPIFA